VNTLSFDCIANKLQLVPTIKKLVKIIPFPFIYGLHTSFAYFELKKTQWLKREEIEKLRDRRLRYIVRFAYKNVPFYHRKLRELGLHPTDIKGKKDIKKLPILYREDIIKNYDKFFSKHFKFYGGRINYTGGTTGSPLGIFLSGKAMGYKRAVILRFYDAVGLCHGKKVAYLRPPPSLQQGVSNHTLYEYFDFNKSLYLSNYEMSDKIMSIHISKLKEFKPYAISGTPSSLYLISQYMIRNSIEIPSIEVVLSTSETLYPYQKKIIEEAFGCDVFQSWGQGEMVGAAFECKDHGFHLAEEIGVVEVLKDNEDASEGEVGNLVGTTLINKSMPLIRYYIGDAGVVSNDSCICGRGLPLIEKILGKTRENIVTKSGRKIPGEIFTWVVMRQDWIKESQIIQPAKNKLVIKIVPSGEISKEKEINIVRQIRNIVGDDEMNIVVEYVDRIYPTTAGKRPFVISKVSQ